ncbi:tetratricopeptide repeat protein [Cellvibrio mixtus]|nr:tetratricopeptide repeat protein [Cellvibrio mixtus]
MAAADSHHCEQTLMFTDIVGYSRLMGRNEAMAIDMLGDYRQILLFHIEGQGGQLVECIGDAIFARFDSAAQAAAAAIAIQQHLQAFNEPGDKKLPRLQTRIGLHKGEVTLRDNAVFGDTVNIAARLEPLAVADGICISQTVYDDIRLSLSAPAKYLGVQTLKNIEQKIRVYLIKPAGINWRDHLHYFLRGLTKKIITYRYPLTACLFVFIAAGFYFVPRWLVPGYTANYVEIADFQNLMNEKGDADYFSAGITEAVRSQLADMRDVYIVDTKEGIHAPIRLEGSVQRLGDNLRIAYRLFRRKDNVQIAGGKLDGTYQDIFILQDRLVGEIARYLADEFDLQNFRPAPLRLTGSVTAYDYYLQGLEYLHLPASHKTADEAIQSFTSALIHDKQFSLANAGLCSAYWKKYEITNSASWLNNAENHCLLALEQDNRSSIAYRAIGAIYRDTGNFEKAIEYLSRGLRVDPKDILTAIDLAMTYNFINDKPLAESIYIAAIKSAPKNWRVYDGYGYFLTLNGRYEEAIENYKKVISLTSSNVVALNNIGINYFYKSQYSDAAEYFERASSIEPSSVTFANTGNMYYSAGNFQMAIRMYEKSHRLEPENYQWMAYLADAYKFIPNEKSKSDEYFKLTADFARKEIALNPELPRAYHYLARSLACLGDLDGARKVMQVADTLETNSTDSIYTHLRIAILEENDDKIVKYVRYLLDTEYSDKLIWSDPDFSVLKDSRFEYLFFNKLMIRED